MGVYRDQGLVLRTMRLGEADRIVTLLTHDHGKIRAVVKGVRRTKSRFGARLEPFSHVDLQLWEGRSDLQVVSQAELLRAFSAIREDYEAYLCGQVMCEAVDRVAPDHEPNVRLVLLLLAGLRALDDQVRAGMKVPHTLRSAFLLKLLGLSGFGPALRVCVQCGSDEGLSAFAIADGGVVCTSCRGPGDATLTEAGLHLLQGMWNTKLEDLPDMHTGEVDGIVARVVEYHLDCRLRSLAARPA